MKYIYKMPQKQGQDSTFFYYTFDNEDVSKYPHIHICVSNNDKIWTGKSFSNGENLKIICSVRLSIEHYSLANLIFGKIYDNKIKKERYKTQIVDWLKAENIDYMGKSTGQTNSEKAFNDYFMNNPNCQHKLEYLKMGLND